MKKRAFLAPVALSVAALVANVAEPDKAFAADPFMTSSVGMTTRTLGQAAGRDFILSRDDAVPAHFGHSSHASHASHSSHSSHSSHYSGSVPVPGGVDTSTYAPAPVYVPPPTPTPKPKHKRPKAKHTPRPR